MKEIWKEIEGFEGLYSVSNLGRVRSEKREVKTKDGRILPVGGKVLKPWETGGYNLIALWRDNKEKTYYIHRLVAQAFIDNPNNLPEVNHKDEIRSNNRFDNLEWCSRQYNSVWGTSVSRSVKKRSKKVLQFTTDGKFVREWPSAISATREGFGNVAGACNGYQKTACGYIFKYKEE